VFGDLTPADYSLCVLLCSSRSVILIVLWNSALLIFVQVLIDRKAKFVCVFVENSCHGDAVVTDGRESVMLCWLLTEIHRRGFLSHFCTATAIGNSGITLFVITIYYCVMRFVVSAASGRVRVFIYSK